MDLVGEFTSMRSGMAGYQMVEPELDVVLIEAPNQASGPTGADPPLLAVDTAMKQTARCVQVMQLMLHRRSRAGDAGLRRC